MNEYHESVAWGIVVAVIAVTFILSFTRYEMQRARLNAQSVPQVVIESDTP